VAGRAHLLEASVAADMLDYMIHFGNDSDSKCIQVSNYDYFKKGFFCNIEYDVA